MKIASTERVFSVCVFLVGITARVLADQSASGEPSETYWGTINRSIRTVENAAAARNQAQANLDAARSRLVDCRDAAATARSDGCRVPCLPGAEGGGACGFGVFVAAGWTERPGQTESDLLAACNAAGQSGCPSALRVTGAAEDICSELVSRFGSLTSLQSRFRYCANAARQCGKVRAGAACDLQEARLERLTAELAAREAAFSTAAAAAPVGVGYCSECEAAERARPTTRDYVLSGIMGVLNIGGQVATTALNYAAFDRYTTAQLQMYDRACQSRIDAGYFCNAPVPTGGVQSGNAGINTMGYSGVGGVGPTGGGGYSSGSGSLRDYSAGGQVINGQFMQAGFVRRDNSSLGGGVIAQIRLADPYAAMLVANGSAGADSRVGAFGQQNSHYAGSIYGVGAGLNAGWVNPRQSTFGSGAIDQQRFGF